MKKRKKALEENSIEEARIISEVEQIIRKLKKEMEKEKENSLYQVEEKK